MLSFLGKVNRIYITREYSSLSCIFNSNEYLNFNRKFEKEKITGLFNITDLKGPSGFLSLRYKCESDIRLLLQEALSSLRSRKIVEVLDEMSDCICQVADLAECMRLLHPDSTFRNVAGMTCKTMSQLVEQLNTNEELFNVLNDVVKSSKDVSPLDEIDIRVGQLLHADFEASGIHLPNNMRQRFVEETQKIFDFGSEFYSGTEIPSTISVGKLPKHLQNKLNLKADHSIEISHPFAFADDPMIREMGYRVFYAYNHRQEELLRNLTESRYNLAKYSGFSSYSERANIHAICNNSLKIEQFMSVLSSRLLPSAEDDRLTILRRKYGKELTAGDLYDEKYQLLPWDFQYFIHSLKQSSLLGGYEAYSPYFSLGACMEGINSLIKSQFGLYLDPVESIPGELWHPDVFKVNVCHRINGHLGVIYCDMFARYGKPTVDCHYTIRAGRQLPNGEYQTPIIVLHSSLTPVSSDNSSLAFLSPPAVETLFHEWGHALHSLLARTRYQHVAGTRCGTDLAEVPSSLMEYFALDCRVVKEYARHYQTKERLPDKMLSALSKQKYVCSAIEQQMTIANSLFDHAIHQQTTPLVTGQDSSSIYDNIFGPNSIAIGTKVFDLPVSTDYGRISWPQRFGHLINYAGKFYSYLMSNCIAGFLWKTAFSEDPWSSSVGERYRSDILQHGGQYKPLDLISKFADSKNGVKVVDLIDGFIDDVHQNRCNNK